MTICLVMEKLTHSTEGYLGHISKYMGHVYIYWKLQSRYYICNKEMYFCTVVS